MMLLVLDKNPVQAADKVPNKLKFKQLLELCQMICSCGFSDIYKKIPQGKAIQEWIKRNPYWVKAYSATLLLWCTEFIKMKDKTFNDILKILASINTNNKNLEIETAIFRYSQNYYLFTNFSNNSELPIDIAIQEYTKYLQWKGYLI